MNRFDEPVGEHRLPRYVAPARRARPRHDPVVWAVLLGMLLGAALMAAFAWSLTDVRPIHVDVHSAPVRVEAESVPSAEPEWQPSPTCTLSPPPPPPEWADGGYECMARMMEAGTWEGDFGPCKGRRARR